MNLFGTRNDSRSEFLISCGGVFLIGASLSAPWLRGRIGSNVERSSGWGLLSARVFVILLIVAALASAFAVAKSNWDFARCVQSAAAVIALVVPIFVIVFAEVSVIWFSPDLLPPILRRFSVGVGPGWGLWVLMAGGAALLLGALGKSHQALARVKRIAQNALKLDISAIGIIMMLTAIPLLVMSRYASWIHIASPTGDADLPGWALPWAGPLSAVICVLLVGGALAILLTRSSGAAVGMVILGWAVSATAASTLILGSLPKLSAPEWLGRAISKFADAGPQSDGARGVTRLLVSRLDTSSLKFEMSRGWGAYLAFSAGLLLMFACSLIARARLRTTSIREG